MNNFTFDTLIPASGNNPSNDQPRMQINNVSTAALIAFDHIGFNVNNGGQHKQITFNIDVPGYPYTPILPASPPVLFAMNDAFATPQLYWYSGADVKSSLQYTAATNGSTFAFGGIIFKWITYTLAANIDVVTFAGLGLANFPNTAFNGQATVIFNNGTQGLPNITALNAAGFTIHYTAGGQLYMLFIGN
jgi:hypothetical protein